MSARTRAIKRDMAARERLVTGWGGAFHEPGGFVEPVKGRITASSYTPRDAANDAGIGALSIQSDERVAALGSEMEPETLWTKPRDLERCWRAADGDRPYRCLTTLRCAEARCST